MQTDHELKPLSVDVTHLNKVVVEERNQIREMEKRVENLVTYCKTERHTLQTKLNKTQYQLQQCQNNLRKQCRENKKIQVVATCAQQTQQQLEISNKTLSASLDEMRMKYMKTRTTLLAVKGRNSMDMKRQHRAEEEEERRLMVCEFEKEKEMKQNLQMKLKAKEEELKSAREMLNEKETEVEEFGAKYQELKQGVEDRLSQLDTELQTSRNELLRLRELLTNRQVQLDKTQQSLQDERKRTFHLLTQSQATITHLSSQIEQERAEHEEQLHELTLAISTQKHEYMLQIERMKDVSTQRCTQLAQEIWILKAELGKY